MPQTYFPRRVTATPSGIDPRIQAALAINQHHNWMGAPQEQDTSPVQNPYADNEFAPSLEGLSPTGRYNDMKMRRVAMYQNLMPRGEQIVNGQPMPMAAATIQAMQPDIDSGIGYGTNPQGNPIAVTPLGGTITTLPSQPVNDGTGEAYSPIRRVLTPNRYGTGSSIDTGVMPHGTFPITMASGERFQVPLSTALSTAAQTFQNQQNSAMKVEGKPNNFTDVGGDKEFQDLMAKLKRANSK